MHYARIAELGFTIILFVLTTGAFFALWFYFDEEQPDPMPDSD
jgi:hypothetical protein